MDEKINAKTKAKRWRCADCGFTHKIPASLADAKTKGQRLAYTVTEREKLEDRGPIHCPEELT